MDPATAAPVMTCPPFLSACITQITDQISFTPPAVRRAPPRAWERVPSTPFLARHKSRKIWKRFRTSMQGLRGQKHIRGGEIEENELVNEINASANAEFLRGVKRRCLRISVDTPDSQQLGRSRSFLETKWELEIGRRKRKFVVMAADEESSTMTWGAEQERLAGCGEDIQVSAGTKKGQHIATPEAKTNATTDDVVNNYADADRDTDSPRSRDRVDPAEADVDSEEAADIQHLTATQESTLVRSALRMNSLDGEDAALLSEFLSRAQAKRAANATMIPKDADKAMGEELVPNSPSVRSRRALEELDKNSPSLQKPQLSSPTKAEKTSDSPTSPMKDETDEDSGNQASPAATRRSKRTRLPKLPTRAPRPAVPNQIPVRRANGTEFVFLQRTEAQELSLTTRRNTRRNKGEAQLPKYALQAMAKRQQEENRVSSSQPDNSDLSTAPVRRSPRKRAGTKQVSWKEEQLVEYAAEKSKDSSSSSSSNDIVSAGADKKKTASLRSSRSTTREREKGKEETVAASPATPRRVRRLALPTTTNITATSTSAGADTTSASTTSSAKPIAVSTPIPKRKKLTPKSPGGGLLSLPAKAALRKTANSGGKAGVKTANTNTTTTSKKTTSIPTSANNGKTQSSLLKAGLSSAGATPLPKRVRAKKVA